MQEMRPSRAPPDRRRSIRFPTDMRVYVLAAGRPACRTQMLDISQHGAFVTWNYDHTPVGPHVVVVFTKAYRSVVRTLRKRAVVMRRFGPGIGLKFIPAQRSPN